MPSTEPLPIILSNAAIVEIWRYCSFLTYSLLAESAKYKQKNNVQLFLNNIILNLTQNDQQCSLKIESSGPAALKGINTCIISSILNVMKSIILILTIPFSVNLSNSLVNIIMGKPVKLPDSESSIESSKIFDQILQEYPLLAKYIGNDSTEYAEIIKKLNIIYDYLEKQATESYDVTKLDNQRIQNRINFFSSIPTKSPQSMLPTSEPSSPTSSKSADSEDDDLMNRLKIMTELPIFKPNDKKSTQLKPPGMIALKQEAAAAADGAPFYGADVQRPVDTGRAFDIEHGVGMSAGQASGQHFIDKQFEQRPQQSYLATSDQRKMFEDLQEEFWQRAAI